MTPTAVFAAAGLLWAAASSAQPGSLAAGPEFPVRPLTLIVPVAPGGPVDIAARVLAPEVARLLGQPVTVDNRAGASQKIGIQALLRSPKDGYVFAAISPASATINPLIDPAIGYEPLKDFTLLSQSVGYLMVVVVRPSLPVHSLAELKEYGEARPGKLTFGTGGNGTALHFSTEELLLKLGIRAVHVPYKSDAPAFNDLLAGQIDMMLAAVSQAAPTIEAGRIVALATSGSRRSPQLPQVPAYSETGIAELRNYSYRAWVGFAAPGGIPAQAARRLEDALIQAVRIPQVRDSLTAKGYEVIGSTPRQFAEDVAEELRRNRAVIAAGGVKVD
jgi:tripartite-type tricarboxylate transporter receptor subunit TctC